MCGPIALKKQRPLRPSFELEAKSALTTKKDSHGVNACMYKNRENRTTQGERREPSAREQRLALKMANVDPNSRLSPDVTWLLVGTTNTSSPPTRWKMGRLSYRNKHHQNENTMSRKTPCKFGTMVNTRSVCINHKRLDEAISNHRKNSITKTCRCKDLVCKSLKGGTSSNLR